jgi:RNA polymerase sigma factor for flagellar operon FliA
MAEEGLWQEYQQSNDLVLRDRLILEYLPLVRKIVNAMGGRSFSTQTCEEYYSVGVMGLIDAVHKYNPLRPAKFETYASIRIKGSIKDFRRKKDFASRGVRERQTAIEQARQELEQALGRTAEDEEIAAQAGISLSEYHSVLGKVNHANMVSFEESVEKGISDVCLNSYTDGPEETLIRSEMKQKLAKEISKLNEREQLILSLYYKEELTLKEIGEVLVVSESRVSQIMKKLLGKIRDSWK